jgi:tripartite ATP-independent transporter DctM subunit
MAGAAPTAKPAPFLKPLDLVDRSFLLAESALSLVIVMVMVLVAVADALSQVFGRFMPAVQQRMLPLTSVSGDILLHGTIWAAFLGASFATRGRKHLAIDALGRLLPDRGRRAVVGVATALGATVAFILARGLWMQLVEDRHTADEQIAAVLQSGGQPRGDERAYEFHYIMPVGFVLIAIRLLLHSFHEFAASFSGTPKAAVAAAKGGDAAYRAEAGDPANKNTADMVEPETGSPVSHATATEIAIALAALLVIPFFARGTTLFRQLATCGVLAAATLAIPLLIRWQKNKSTAPTAPREAEETPRYKPAHMALAIASVAGVLLLARVGAMNVTKISLTVGVLFFAGMAILGAPLFTFLGGLALFLWAHGSADVVPMSLANSVTDAFGPHFARMSVLPTIPVFTLAGYLMSESKTPQRLVRVARAFLGWMPGGLAVVCLIASAFFTVFSGASGITIVAIGGLLYPALVKDKYSEKFSLGLVTTGGALGITFPPALPLIVYGIVAGLQEVPPGHERLELQKFMLAGIVPGVITIVIMMMYAFVMGIVAKVPRAKFDAKEAMAALWETKWEIFLPFFLLGGLATGVLNPSTAAAFTAFYVLVIEVFIYKDLSLTKDLPRIVPESMILVGAIFVKLCAATVLTAYFIQAQTADKLFEWLTCGPPAQAYMHSHADTIGTCREAVDILARTGQAAGGIINSKLSFLIALNFFLLVVGMLMDIFSAIVVIVPLISGIALHFDINPYHLGIVFLLNLEIGYLMPPMGLNLFIAGFRFNRPVPDLYRTVLPFIALFVAALAMITYIPGITMGVVNWRTRQEQAAEAARARANGAQNPVTNTAVPIAADAGAAAAGDGGGGQNCDEQGENESFDEFDRRCNITGNHPEANAGAGTGGGAAQPAAPAIAADCEEQRENESFEEFDVRCNITGNHPPDTGATAPVGGDAAAVTGAAVDAAANAH